MMVGLHGNELYASSAEIFAQSVLTKVYKLQAKAGAAQVATKGELRVLLNIINVFV